MDKCPNYLPMAIPKCFSLAKGDITLQYYAIIVVCNDSMRITVAVIIDSLFLAESKRPLAQHDSVRAIQYTGSCCAIAIPVAIYMNDLNPRWIGVSAKPFWYNVGQDLEIMRLGITG